MGSVEFSAGSPGLISSVIKNPGDGSSGSPALGSINRGIAPASARRTYVVSPSVTVARQKKMNSVEMKDRGRFIMTDCPPWECWSGPREPAKRHTRARHKRPHAHPARGRDRLFGSRRTVLRAEHVASVGPAASRLGGAGDPARNSNHGQRGTVDPGHHRRQETSAFVDTESTTT